MRVLAIDASLRSSGVAIIEPNGGGKFHALHFGVIHNAERAAHVLLPRRHSRSAGGIDPRARAGLLRARSGHLCAELQDGDHAWARRAARAIIAAAERGLPVFEYAPKRIKQATVGNGSADKTQVAFMVRALLGLTETPNDDAADALAIGLTHLRAQEGLRVGLPGQPRI